LLVGCCFGHVALVDGWARSSVLLPQAENLPKETSMMGRKTLAEVRAELKAAVGAGPSGESEVAKSLRRFLTADEQGPDARSQEKEEGGQPAPEGQAAQALRGAVIRYDRPTYPVAEGDWEAQS
jgi:hypothetical protein